MVKELKIIFAGLDFGGKTTIIKALKQKQYAFEGLKPTKGIERFSIDVLDCCFTEWDLGGQDIYRKQYLENKMPFYSTDLLYYVIDIADSNRFSEVLEYYKNIIEIFNTQNLNPPIIMLLNKNDIKEDIQEDVVQNLQNSLLNISKDFKIEFFRTSIYEPQTLMHAFSHGINKISKQTSELSAQLKDMAAETFSDAILLIEGNGFILGDYSKDEQSRKMGMIVYDNLIGAFSLMYKTLQKSEKPERIIIDWEDEGNAFLDSTEIDNFEFFYIRYTSNPRKVVQKFVLRSLIQSSKQIKDIIKNYFG